MANLPEVTEKNWDSEVLASQTPVLVDFWAQWCAPCRALAPTVEALAGEFAGRMNVVKVDIDTSGALGTRYGVMSIPTLLLFKGGKVVEQIVGGGQTKERLAAKLEPHLA